MKAKQILQESIASHQKAIDEVRSRIVIAVEFENVVNASPQGDSPILSHHMIQPFARL